MSSITVKTVNSIEEWLQCQQIRAAAFLITEPYEEEFDGKDLEMVTHLLAHLNGLPVACMRLTLYSPKNGGTIHWGRLAMMPNTISKARLRVLNSIADFAAEYSDKCGYNKCIGEVTDERLLKFWKRRGFIPTNEKSVCCGGRHYKKIARKKAIVPFIARNKVGNANDRRSDAMQ